MKYKIKIFESDDIEKFEKKVNDFINGEICKYLKIQNILDVQYAPIGRHYSAMVVYEEYEEEGE